MFFDVKKWRKCHFAGWDVLSSPINTMFDKVSNVSEEKSTNENALSVILQADFLLSIWLLKNIFVTLQCSSKHSRLTGAQKNFARMGCHC